MKARLPLLFAALVLALVLIALACATPRFTTSVPELGTPQLVTGFLVYQTRDEVPSPLAPLVPADVVAGPVYFAQAQDAVCYVTAQTFAWHVTVGQRLTCPWRWPRGA